MENEGFAQQMLGFDGWLKTGRPAACGCRMPHVGGVGVPHQGRANDVPQIGAVACYRRSGRAVFTRRAPSSPHHACGLNGAFFLRPCGPLAAASAGRLLGVLERSETCRTLRRWMFFATLILRQIPNIIESVVKIIGEREKRADKRLGTLKISWLNPI
ncbi:hypothetical protein H045_14135 [Pseudomonas poae RE*1-1-14]|nr:hypothetical protein H045_14135 [Pseudomonas poae RE*1-1-14]